ncbi:hypothetical protein HanPSC8_Chr02g0071901 [Helianthus annuus]|nr:hypothetical protein HanPSC8_Chr02g0071901 [Helianthus annuus]
MSIWAPSYLFLFHYFNLRPIALISGLNVIGPSKWGLGVEHSTPNSQNSKKRPGGRLRSCLGVLHHKNGQFHNEYTWSKV